MFLNVCLSEHAHESLSVNAHVCRFYQSIRIFKLLFLSVLLPRVYVRIHSGDRGSGPPTPPENTGYMGFYRNKYLDPPPPWEKLDPPLENVGPPLDPLKSIVFSVINFIYLQSFVCLLWTCH